MDCTLQGLEGVICYLDDILVVTKEGVKDHNELVDKVMQRLNEEGWGLKPSKSELSVNKLTWLGTKSMNLAMPRSSQKSRLSKHYCHRKHLNN